LLAGLIFAVATPWETVGQAPAGPAGGRNPVSLRKVDGKKETTPVYAVKGAGASGRSKEWFRVFAEYDTDAKWLDEVSFTFYVLVKGKTPDVPPFTLFKGETSYIHVPEGKKHEADMFLHPNVLARYGDIERVAVEVRIGGRVVGRDGKPTPTSAWWEQFAPNEGSLLNRGQTPFALVDYDNYEIIKPK
jgi:hypothetical protein